MFSFSIVAIFLLNFNVVLNDKDRDLLWCASEGIDLVYPGLDLKEIYWESWKELFESPLSDESSREAIPTDKTGVSKMLWCDYIPFVGNLPISLDPVFIDVFS